MSFAIMKVQEALISVRQTKIHFSYWVHRMVQFDHFRQVVKFAVPLMFQYLIGFSRCRLFQMQAFHFTFLLRSRYQRHWRDFREKSDWLQGKRDILQVGQATNGLVKNHAIHRCHAEKMEIYPQIPFTRSERSCLQRSQLLC